MLHWYVGDIVIAKVFEVKVGMHQRSALSPLLFVMEAISREL